MTPFLYMMKVSKPNMHTTVLLHSATSMLTTICCFDVNTSIC